MYRHTNGMTSLLQSEEMSGSVELSSGIHYNAIFDSRLPLDIKLSMIDALVWLFKCDDVTRTED